MSLKSIHGGKHLPRKSRTITFIVIFRILSNPTNLDLIKKYTEFGEKNTQSLRLLQTMKQRPNHTIPRCTIHLPSHSTCIQLIVYSL